MDAATSIGWVPSAAYVADIMTRPSRYHELRAGLRVDDEHFVEGKLELPPLGATAQELIAWMREMRARAAEGAERRVAGSAKERSREHVCRGAAVRRGGDGYAQEGCDARRLRGVGPRLGEATAFLYAPRRRE